MNSLLCIYSLFLFILRVGKKTSVWQAEALARVAGACHSLVCVSAFLHWLQRPSIRAVADFKAISCPPPQKFIKCTDLDFTTSPAIAFIQCCMSVLSLRPCVGAA